MKQFLAALNKTPGVLGCAYLGDDGVVSDIGEAIGGPEAIPLAKRAADACAEWNRQRGGAPMESAVFVGSNGRIVVRPAGSGMLVAFAENDASAGLLKLRMREVAEQMSGAAPQEAPRLTVSQA